MGGWCIIKPSTEERMNVMDYNNYTRAVEEKLISEIGQEKKFLTFRKLLKIFELKALLSD